MFFSIIIPVYNVEKYLDDCIRSVTEQDFKNYEIIIVDDGSTDSSGKICDLWEARINNEIRDIQIKVIHQKNKGLDGARNSALEVASGEWLIFLDSDDMLANEMLAKLYNKIHEYPADMYCYNMMKIDECGNKIENGIYHCEYENILLRDDKEKLDYYVKRLITYRDSWEVIFRCYNGKIIREHNLKFSKCSDIFAEDLLFTMEYLLWVKRIQFLCDIFYQYRQVPESIMHTLDQRTILPRIINLIHTFYDKVKKEKNKYLVKNFSMICIGILDFHISHKMNEISIDEIREQIDFLKKQKLFKKWLKNKDADIYENPDLFMLRPWL